MKKSVFLSIALFCLLLSCSDGDLPKVNGMWQLKTIEEAGNLQTVDTVYYSFQAQQLFAFTQLNARFMQFEPTLVVYGYVEFPAENQLYIHMDEAGGQYFPILPWHSESVTYTIRKLTSKEMILEQEAKIYRFIKF
jgi:hypothetical protein